MKRVETSRSLPCTGSDFCSVSYECTNRLRSSVTGLHMDLRADLQVAPSRNREGIEEHGRERLVLLKRPRCDIDGVGEGKCLGSAGVPA